MFEQFIEIVESLTKYNTEIRLEQSQFSFITPELFEKEWDIYLRMNLQFSNGGYCI